MTTADFKASFSSVVDELKKGNKNKVVITYGSKKEPLATIIPQSELDKSDYSVKVDDLKFEMSEEELLNRR